MKLSFKKKSFDIQKLTCHTRLAKTCFSLNVKEYMKTKHSSYFNVMVCSLFFASMFMLTEYNPPKKDFIEKQSEK